MATLLEQQAQLIVDTSADRNLSYNNLNEYQKENLTAIAYKEMAFQTEAIDDAVLSDEFKTKIIEALEEKHFADKNILLKEIGLMLVNNVKKHLEPEIQSALEKAQTKLAVMRQFYDEDGHYDYKNNKEPMKAAIYNHPEI